jgi:SAM-dependent methyltransferase
MNNMIVVRKCEHAVRHAGAKSYALGYSAAEFQRLRFQGEYFRDFTDNVLRQAGIAPSMHVLDIGSGIGDVSLLVAKRVGRSGSVLGVDRSEAAVAIARERAAEAGLDNVRFVACELDAFVPEQKFDAIVGRLILAYLPDPAATLRKLSCHLRPGGTIAFQEMAAWFARSVPEGPEFRKCSYYLLETFACAGFDLDMGGKLFATFLDAGLRPPQMVAAARLEGGAQAPIYDYLANTLRSLLPMAERFGVATAAEVDIDGVAERLRREAVENNACIMLPPLVGAWTRIAGPAG